MTKFYAFEIHCEELLDPPVLAVIQLNQLDLDELKLLHGLFQKTRRECATLSAMSFFERKDTTCWFTAEAVPQEVTDALQSGGGTCTLTETMANRLCVQEERWVEDIHLHIDDKGLWFTATVRHSDVTVLAGVLAWEQLEIGKAKE